MFYEKTGQATLARSWNLSDDLGQIEYLFSDKTGTLTQNSMVFRRCSIGGQAYADDTESEAVPKAEEGNSDSTSVDVPDVPAKETAVATGKLPFFHSAKLSKDISESLDSDSNSPNAALARSLDRFFTVLALCHTVLTSNSMVFRRCSIGGQAYADDTESEAVPKAEESNSDSTSVDVPDVPTKETAAATGKLPFFHSAKLSKDISESLHSDSNSPNAALARSLNRFFTVLALCHTVLTSVDPETGKIEYKAQSPDEAALVKSRIRRMRMKMAGTGGAATNRTSTRSSRTAPAVTQNPVSASAQACFPSYASRLRTGATLLVQPTIFPRGSGNASDSNIISSIPTISTSAYTSSTRASRRSRTSINYAEPDADNDDENDKTKAADPDDRPDAGALDDDANDGDLNAGRAGKTLAMDGAELDQSYLGKVPPSKFIKSYGMLTSAATMPAGAMVSLDYGPSYGSAITNDQKPTISPPILIPTFLWNLHENDDSSGITPEIFAAQFCRDLDIAVDPYAEMVSRQMRAQVEDARGEAWTRTNQLMNSNKKWIWIWMAKPPQINPECWVILSIDVQIATYHLTDHIEWDLLSPLTPKIFSIPLCKDLGLTGEAVPFVAHAVHEELCRHRKDLVEWGIVTLSNAWNDKNSNRGDEIARDRTGLGLGNLGRPSRERDRRYPKALKSAWRDWVEVEEYATR
ncbi:hypothetical protein F5878DRAFT_695771 [Lentinula raphanica]|uniref:Uncharacterized protein n=1 Tax=Lentinula raphanica TaxID=153919 RepID=A0AA38P1I3_9AGAR|nr:hypothetical protein F5878DRAFT_695771 [Lentinula raphanica]